LGLGFAHGRTTKNIAFRSGGRGEKAIPRRLSLSEQLFAEVSGKLNNSLCRILFFYGVRSFWCCSSRIGRFGGHWLRGRPVTTIRRGLWHWRSQLSRKADPASPALGRNSASRG
jgi:hypothetical protein